MQGPMFFLDANSMVNMEGLASAAATAGSEKERSISG